MAADMKTLRKALKTLGSRASPSIEPEEVHLAHALDELEALRADASAALRVANALTQETQTLEASATDLVRLVREARALRDESLAALQAWLSARDIDPMIAARRMARAALDKARGGA